MYSSEGRHFNDLIMMNGIHVLMVPFSQFYFSRMDFIYCQCSGRGPKSNSVAPLGQVLKLLLPMFILQHHLPNLMKKPFHRQKPKQPIVHQ